LERPVIQPRQEGGVFILKKGLLKHFPADENNPDTDLSNNFRQLQNRSQVTHTPWSG
jgi:hypothetical protein